MEIERAWQMTHQALASIDWIRVFSQEKVQESFFCLSNGDQICIDETIP